MYIYWAGQDRKKAVGGVFASSLMRCRPENGCAVLRGWKVNRKRILRHIVISILAGDCRMFGLYLSEKSCLLMRPISHGSALASFKLREETPQWDDGGLFCAKTHGALEQTSTRQHLSNWTTSARLLSICTHNGWNQRHRRSAHLRRYDPINLNERQTTLTIPLPSQQQAPRSASASSTPAGTPKSSPPSSPAPWPPCTPPASATRTS